MNKHVEKLQIELQIDLEEYLATSDLLSVESLTDAVLNLIETYKEIETLRSYLFKKAKK